MAQAEIQYGSNAQLIQLAKTIVTMQTAEVQQFDQILLSMPAVSQAG